MRERKNNMEIRSVPESKMNMEMMDKEESKSGKSTLLGFLAFFLSEFPLIIASKLWLRVDPWPDKSLPSHLTVIRFDLNLMRILTILIYRQLEIMKNFLNCIRIF